MLIFGITLPINILMRLILDIRIRVRLVKYFFSRCINEKSYKYLTFIPARSNSKGLKNKNLKTITGKKLIEITINFIKELKIKNNYIFVSTDSEKISRISKNCGANVDFLRSKKIIKI